MGLPRRASQLPLTAISLGLQAWERSRGLREFALRRGNEALQIASMTPIGRLLPKQLLDDGADEEAARIVADARDAAPPQPRPAAPVRPEPPARPEPPSRPVEPPAAAKAVGAPGAVTEQVEKITEQLHLDAPTGSDELPVPDFDNISIGSLRARLRSLTVEQLVVLREWEQAHANRLQVITTLDNRIAKVAAQQPAYPADTSAAGNASTASTASNAARAAEATDAAKRAAEEEGGTLRV